MTEGGPIPSAPGTAARTGAAVTVIQRANRLPLPAIAAAMLAAATAFFCYAMPQARLADLLWVLGVTGPVGSIGRALFGGIAAAAAAWIGWYAVRRAGSAGRSPAKTGSERHEPGPANAAPAYPPGTIEGAPPPRAVPRDDRSDAVAPDVPPSGGPGRGGDEPPPGRSDDPGPKVEPPPSATDDEEEAPVAAAEMRSPSAAPVIAEPQERSISALLARFERGLERRGGDLPPPPDVERLAALHDALPASEETLRTAIEALRRIPTRPA